jgi:membrane protein required for colicin V production
MSIGLLDITILVIIAASAIWGIFKGFVRQIVGIAALLLGLWCAFKFTSPLSAQVKELFSLEIAQNIMHIIIFAAIFLLVMILSHFIGKGIEGIIRLGMLGWFNRLLGFLFGAIKATIILSVIAYVVNYANNLLHIIPQSVFADSKGYTFLIHFQQNIFPFLENIFS